MFNPVKKSFSPCTEIYQAQRETDRQRQRQTDRQTETETDTERDRDTDTESEEGGRSWKEGRGKENGDSQHDISVGLDNDMALGSTPVFSIGN